MVQSPTERQSKTKPKYILWGREMLKVERLKNIPWTGRKLGKLYTESEKVDIKAKKKQKTKKRPCRITWVNSPNSPGRYNHFKRICATHYTVSKQNKTRILALISLRSFSFLYLTTYWTLAGWLKGTKHSAPKPNIITFSYEAWPSPVNLHLDSGIAGYCPETLGSSCFPFPSIHCSKTTVSSWSCVLSASPFKFLLYFHTVTALIPCLNDGNTFPIFLCLKCCPCFKTSPSQVLACASYTTSD